MVDLMFCTTYVILIKTCLTEEGGEITDSFPPHSAGHPEDIALYKISPYATWFNVYLVWD